MEQIDFDFLVIFISGVSLIMGIYMVFLYKNTGVKGTGYWATGSISVGVAILFKILPIENGFLFFVAPTLLITIGLYFYLAGIWLFKGKKINKWIVFGIPIANFIQSLIFYQFFPSHKVRLILYSLFLIFYCAIAIYEMLKLTDEQKHFQNLFRLNAVSFFCFFGLLVLRVIVILNQPNFYPVNSSTTAIAMFLISGFIMIALTFGFVMSVNLHLYNELESQLKSKTKFFAIIAHDLRGSVGTIMNFLNLLNTESGLVEKERKFYLERLEQLSQSTFHLLQNLLEWSTSSKNISKIEREEIELNKLINKNIEFFQRLAKFKSIKVEFNEGVQTYIKGDEKMLETIMRNLVSNSLKFTPKGGKITIETQNISDKVRLSVKDTGQGIAPEKLSNIFRFSGSKSTLGTEGEVGSGLGLALCKEFIKKNSGTIQIKSKVNIGTEIIIEFPKSDAVFLRKYSLN